MAGRFDDLLADIQPQGQQPPAASVPTGGRFADLLSDITPAATQRKPLGVIDKAKLIGKMYGAARDEMDPTSQIKKKILEPAGEKIAEVGGKSQIPGLANDAAMLGTVVSEAPAFLSAATTLGGLYNSEDPTALAEGIRNTPRDLSPRYTALDSEAGISGDLPLRRGTVPKFPGLNGLPSNAPPPEAPMVAPSVYPKDPNALLNFMKARLSAYGDKLSPQELRDYDSMLGTMLKGRELAPGTEQYAIASQRAAENTPLLNKAVAGRADLDKIYAISKKLRIAPELAKSIWSYLGPKFRWGDILVQ